MGKPRTGGTRCINGLLLFAGRRPAFSLVLTTGRPLSMRPAWGSSPQLDSEFPRGFYDGGNGSWKMC